MSGKFPNNFVFKLFFLIFLPLTIYAQQPFSINNYEVDNPSKQYLEGLRLQGTGDFFFKNKAYVKAIPYYQQALQLIPDDADITFRLAESYQKQSLWNLAISYYEETISLLALSKNFEKSQLNRYISEIRIAKIHYQKNDKETSRAMLEKIRRESSLIQSLYPEALDELAFFDKIYPSTAVRQPSREE